MPLKSAKAAEPQSLAEQEQRRRDVSIGNESVPKIITTRQIYFLTAINILVISNITVSECCLINLLPYIFFEKYIDISALEMVGTSTVPVVSVHFRSLLRYLHYASDAAEKRL